MFVVFEGLDGSGKSTLMTAFKEHLNAKSRAYVEVFDPGGTPVGDKIRQILLTKDHVPSDEAELLMYQASRAELVFKVIKPALEKNQWVISDRFYQSTLAFQGHARGINLEKIDWLNDYATGGLAPDVVVWVNTPVEVCSERLQKRKNRGEDLSRLDEEKRAFHQRVYEGYKSMSEKPSENTRWIVLDGNKTPSDLKTDLISSFEKLREA